MAGHIVALKPVSFEGLSEEETYFNRQTFRPAPHECSLHSEASARMRFVFQSRSCPRFRAQRADGYQCRQRSALKEPCRASGRGESSGGRAPDMIRVKAERGCLPAGGITGEG